MATLQLVMLVLAVAAVWRRDNGVGASKGIQHVTCGSVVKLLNTAHGVRLHSHEVKYGSGSGQQSVTGSDLKEDVNSHWMVKGKEAKSPCGRGQPVQCDSEVRLQHITTGRNLHSHQFRSPLSNQQEVSAFGEQGEGDTGDVWRVVCNGDAWARDDSVSFKHVDTGAFLSVSGRTYGRPIQGQMEVVAVTRPDSASKWKTAEGIFIHPSNFNPIKAQPGHDEL